MTAPQTIAPEQLETQVSGGHCHGPRWAAPNPYYYYPYAAAPAWRGYAPAYAPAWYPAARPWRGRWW
jgi:hypothetical protein